jgi:hypothetical protein
MTGSETYTDLGPDDDARGPAGDELGDHAADALTAHTDARRPLRHRRKLIALTACAALLGLLGWLAALSTDRSRTLSSADRAETAQVSAWAKGPGSQTTVLQASADALAADVAKPDLAAVTPDAAALQHLLAAADVLPLIPDGEANADWETALAEYSSAVLSALAGADGSRPQALANAATLIGAGDAQLGELAARLRELAG